MKTELQLTTMNRIAAASVLITTAVCIAGDRTAKVFQWPEVAPTQRTFFFPDARKATAALEIHARDGTSLYRLQCYGSQADRSRFDPQPGDLYTGEFDCHLYPIPNASRVETLLLDPTDETEESGESYGRAVVGSYDLVGSCANYPEYGRVRDFRLRGMKITFRYSGVKIEQELESGDPGIQVSALRSFRFTVDIASDPTAVSAMAEPVEYSRPPPKKTPNPNVILPDCNMITRRRIPGHITETYIRIQKLAPPYIRVRPVEAEGTFAGREPNSLHLTVPEETGKAAYQIECAAKIGQAGLDEWGIRCQLRPAGSDFDLLADAIDPYSQWSPALITPEQLYGPCARYPEWGDRRTFRLRAVKLTLEVLQADFAPAPPRYPPGLTLPQFLLNKLTLRASVTPDATATSPIALAPKYLYWGVLSRNACETVLVRPNLKSDE